MNYNLKKLLPFMLFGGLLFFNACKDDEPAPEVSARFTVEQDATDPLKFTFTNESLNASTYLWDFGDGETSTEESLVYTYAIGGNYTVTLTATGDGGTDSREEAIEAVLPLEKLTGTDAAGKSWKMVRQGLGIILGPTGDPSTVWWSFGEGGFSGFSGRHCFMTDEFIFRPDGKFEYKANGEFFSEEPWGGSKDFICTDENGTDAWKNDNGDNLSGWAPGVRDFTYDANNDILDLIGVGARMGLFKVGTDSVVNFPQSHVDYIVTKLEDVENGVDTLKLTAQYVKSDGTDVSWYFTYVSYDNPDDEPILELPLPSANFSVEVNGSDVTFTNTSTNTDSYMWDFGDGTSSTEENPPVKTYADGQYTITLTCTNPQGTKDKTRDISIGVPPITDLMIDFESSPPTWTTFNGNGNVIAESTVANPDASGINTSATVLQVTQDAGVSSWAGLLTVFGSKFDLTTKQTIKIKVYAPASGQAFLLKLEDAANNTIKESHEILTTSSGVWEELSFTFDPANTDKFDKFVMFLDFNGKSAATVYYIDDITF